MRTNRKWWIIIALVAIIIIVPIVYYISSDREVKDLDESTRKELGGTYVRLSDGVTHYELLGSTEGRVVVLVHGGSIPMWCWDSQVIALAAADLRVLRYDMYARGYSDRPQVDYDRALYRRQLLELLDSLALEEPVDLVGMSFGGSIAADFTAHYPGRVSRLVLISPIVNFAEIDNNDMYQKLLSIPVIGDFLMRTIVLQKYTERAAIIIEPSYMADRYNKLFLEQFEYRGTERAVLSMFCSDALGDYRDIYKKLGKQKRKAMLIWGTADEEISRQMIEEVREAVPYIEFRTIEGSGHVSNFKAPNELNKLLVDFLK